MWLLSEQHRKEEREDEGKKEETEEEMRQAGRQGKCQHEELWDLPGCTWLALPRDPEPIEFMILKAIIFLTYYIIKMIDG